MKRRTIRLGAVVLLALTGFFLPVEAFAQGTWTTKAPIPSASYGLGGAFVGGKFYAISGFATPRLGIYDPTNNTWTTGAPLPADTGYNLRQYFGTAVLDGKIYVVGGDTGGSGDRATLYRYDPALNTWTSLASMPLGARYGLSAAAIDGKIYAVGGYSIGSSTYLNRLEVYDPASNTWAIKASMPIARSGALVGAINGKLLVAGGGNAGGALTALHVYDPAIDSWSTGAPMPFTGNGEGVVLGGRLFSIGAGPSPERRVFAYDAATDSWSTNFDPMPTGRHALGVAADEVNNKLYVVGGWNGSYVSALEVFAPVPQATLTSIAVTPSNPSINVSQTQQFTATGTFGDGTAKLLTFEGAWAARAPMPTARWSSAVGVINNILYTVGGYNPSLGGHVTTVEAYNPATNTWASKNFKPVPQTSAAFGVINGILYLAGGTDCCVNIASLTAYDPTTDTWSTKASMPTARGGNPVGAVMNGLLYVAGGSNAAWEALSTLEVYNPATNTWITKAPMPTGRYHPAGGVVNGILYVVGGRTSGGMFATVEAYDPATDSWTTKASMPTPRAALSVGVVNGLLYAVGGTSGCAPACTALSTVEVYNPATDSWTTQAPLSTARVDLRAGLLNGLLYAVGGYAGDTAFATNEAFTPGDGLTWASSNTSVATVGATGLAAAGATAGISTITATSGSVSGNTVLTVVSPDTTTPTTTAVVSPAANAASWNKANVTVTLTATDNPGGSGVQNLFYASTLTGGPTIGGSVAAATTSLFVVAEGTTTVNYHARDVAGNIEGDRTIVIRLDKTAPALTVPANMTVNATSPSGAVVTFTPTATDATSGVASLSTSPASGSTFPIGTTTVTAAAVDIAGNTATGTFDVIVNPARPFILVNGGTFTADGNPHPATATAKDQANNPVAGTFSISYVPGGSAPVAAGRYSATASFTSSDPAFTSVFPWTPMAPDPHAKVAPAVAEIGGKLYVQGFDQDNFGNQSSFVPRLSIYDSSSNTWTIGASPAIIRAFANAVAINGKLYVVGGCVMSDCRIGTTATLEIYDPVTNTWSNGTPMVTARFGAAAGVIAGKLYVAGGTTACPPCDHPNTTEIYDPATNTWSAGAPIPMSRDLEIGAAVNGRLYVIGGSTGATAFGRVDVYNPATNSWTSGAPMPTPRAGAAAGVMNGKIYVVGGYGTASLTTNESYDPGSDSWTQQAPMSFARTYLSGAVANSRLYVIDGFNGAQSNVNEAYDSSLATVITINPSDTTPPTTNASVPSPNANGWYRFNVNVNLNAFDSGGAASPSGVQSITYTLTGAQTGGGTFNTSSTSFTIFNEGATTVTYHARDNNGNVEADHALTIKLDKTQPTAANLSNVTVNATSSSGAVVTFDLATSDSLSGVDTVVRTQGLASGSPFPHGTTSEAFTITDKAGNTTFRNFSVTVDKTLLSIAVTPASTTMSQGQGQQYTAMGHFTQGSDQILPTSSGGSGGGSVPGNALWQVHFTPMLSLTACGLPGSAAFISQTIAPNGSGVVHQTWGSGGQVQVDGTVTAASIALTLSCVSDAAQTGSLSASWTAARYAGTATLSGATVNVDITGWSAKAPLSTPRFSLGAATVNGIVYVMGAGNPGVPVSVEAYNPTADSWSTVSQLPVSVEGPGVAALGGMIYVAGGHASGGAATGALQAYNPTANSWTSLAPMPTSRAHLALVVAGGKLYAIGGETGSGSGPASSVVEQYDPSTNLWIARTSMATPRKFHVAGALNGDSVIVAAGGPDSSVELYDVASNSWTSGPAMLSSGGAPAAAVVNNALFVFGIGGAGAGVHMFRPVGPQPTGWAAMAAMPTGRGELGVAAVGDVVYAIGGLLAGGSTATGAVESFSTPPPGDLSVTSGSGGGGGGLSSPPTVQWQSTSLSVAGITSFGFATGNGPGQTTIVATANGISCATTSTCATLTVNAPAHITLTLAAGSATFGSVQVTVVDLSAGQTVKTGNLPIGAPQLVDPGLYRLVFTPPSGYTVTPTQVDVTMHAGDDIAIPLHFDLIDTTPPVVTVPANMAREATSSGGAAVIFTVSANDVVDGPTPVSCTPASGSTFAIATTTVSCTSTDAHSNTGLGSFTVTVGDTTPPSVTAPANITAEAISSAGAAVTFSASASDLVDGATAVTCAPASGSTFAIGTTSVSCTSTDGRGNTGSGSFTVTVRDTTPPVVTTSGNVTVPATSPGGGVATFSVSATDSVDGSLPAMCAPASGSLFAIGTTTVTCSATDAHHNTASATLTVTVLGAQQVIANLTSQAAALGFQQGTNLLQNVLKSLANGNVGAVCNQLGAFINQVRAQTGKSLIAADAASLIQSATAARGALGCQ